MNPILRNILAVIAGLVLGGIANMGIIMVSSFIIIDLSLAYIPMSWLGWRMKG